MEEWARRGDGVEFGLRQFEATHPVAEWRGMWLVVSRRDDGRVKELSGPLGEADARDAVRRAWREQT